MIFNLAADVSIWALWCALVAEAVALSCMNRPAIWLRSSIVAVVSCGVGVVCVFVMLFTGSGN